MINCDVLVCIYFAIVQLVRDHMETIRLAIPGVYYPIILSSILAGSTPEISAGRRAYKRR